MSACSSGAPDLGHSQTFSHTQLHVSHLIFWEEMSLRWNWRLSWNRVCVVCSVALSALGVGNGLQQLQVSAYRGLASKNENSTKLTGRACLRSCLWISSQFTHQLNSVPLWCFKVKNYKKKETEKQNAVISEGYSKNILPPFSPVSKDS